MLSILLLTQVFCSNPEGTPPQQTAGDSPSLTARVRDLPPEEQAKIAKKLDKKQTPSGGFCRRSNVKNSTATGEPTTETAAAPNDQSYLVTARPQPQQTARPPETGQPLKVGPTDASSKTNSRKCCTIS